MGTLDSAQWARTAAPEAQPDWDHHSEEGRAALQRYRDALLRRFLVGAQWPTNISKVANVTQRPDECPGAFYKCLCEAFQIYTLFDPEGPDNQRMVNTAFISQSASDIRKKLQKLEGFAGMNISQLIEIANKVYSNREETVEQEARKRMEKKAALLAAALEKPLPPRKGQRPEGKNNLHTGV
uniref:Core shell protein Gag P30 domain-containing protein n=1 Tax=Molossus molossus TaxID=27622 RepID=A0A7J8J6B3_MOLMO|nr:hypothetical protein HJG59_009598 [Molossus molossus]